MSPGQLRELNFEMGSGINNVLVYFNKMNVEGKKYKEFIANMKEDVDGELLLVGVNSKGKHVCYKVYGMKVVKPVLPKMNMKSNIYPKAKVANGINMPVRWTHDPVGLIVHFHAGWADDRNNSIACLKSGVKNGYTYHCLEEDGTLYQSVGMADQGYHCGTHHHRDHVGIEVMCGGKLGVTTDPIGKKVFKTWFDKTVKPENVRYSLPQDNVKEGYYEMFTMHQEKTLIDICMWMRARYGWTSFDNVLGHDEVAPKYKNDPGASLSMSMPEFRAYLEKEWIRRGEKY
jgi:N-acetyl-anhydromuramyl-L-alanine amidase AmpD